MGSTTLIDIIGSMLMGSLLLLAALRMNQAATHQTYESQENLTVQQNMTAIIQTIQSDFERIGYCSDPKKIQDKSRYILYGDKDSVVFSAGLSDNGSLNTVRWYLGAYVPGPNPRIRLLCRQVDSEPVIAANLGVVEFTLEYFDAFRIRIDSVYAGMTPYPQLIQLTVRVEPTAAIDTAYSKNFSYWRQTRLVSRNITLNR